MDRAAVSTGPRLAQLLGRMTFPVMCALEKDPVILFDIQEFNSRDVCAVVLI